MAGFDYHKFADEGHCAHPGCRSRYWYIENGRKYCKRGHEAADFIQFDIDKEDNFGSQGKVSRKKKEKREKPRRSVVGAEARELFVACLQVILRQQVDWLRAKHGLTAESRLEEIVRLLWDWRLRRVADIKPVKDDERNSRKGKGVDRGGLGSSQNSGDGDHGGLAVYSSLSEAAASTDESDASRRERLFRKGRKWWTREVWPLPSILETLAISYLGCLLVRVPVRVGDIMRWAKSNQLPFLNALERIPSSGTERLPNWAKYPLEVKRWNVEGGSVHKAIRDLVSCYENKFQLDSPVLQHRPVLSLYIRDLALTSAISDHVELLMVKLGIRFTFPTSRPRLMEEDSRSSSKPMKRWQLLDDPNVLLTACTVLATKLIYPFDHIDRIPWNRDDPTGLRMNWEVWEEEFAKLKTKYRLESDFEPAVVDKSKAWALTEHQMDEYLDWYQENRVVKGQGGIEDINRLFPLGEEVQAEVPRRPQTSQGPTESEIEERNKTIREAMNRVPPRPDPEDGNPLWRMGDHHQMFQRVEYLTGPVKAFYEEVAELSGLALKDLNRAVYGLETILAAKTAQNG